MLRKDFIIDPYQVYESSAFHADAILLITAILDDTRLKELLELANTLGLSCLVETHNEREVNRALQCGASIIGINNRNLATFDVDINTTVRLRGLIPAERIVVSESGIHNKSDISLLRHIGINAILVGEALVTSNNVSVKLKELLS